MRKTQVVAEQPQIHRYKDREQSYPLVAGTLRSDFYREGGGADDSLVRLAYHLGIDQTKKGANDPQSCLGQRQPTALQKQTGRDGQHADAESGQQDQTVAP